MATIVREIYLFITIMQHINPWENRIKEDYLKNEKKKLLQRCILSLIAKNVDLSSRIKIQQKLQFFIFITIF